MLIGLFGCCILIWVFALCFGVVFVFDCVLGVHFCWCWRFVILCLRLRVVCLWFDYCSWFLGLIVVAGFVVWVCLWLRVFSGVLVCYRCCGWVSDYGDCIWWGWWLVVIWWLCMLCL